MKHFLVMLPLMAAATVLSSCGKSDSCNSLDDTAWTSENSNYYFHDGNIYGINSSMNKVRSYEYICKGNVITVNNRGKFCGEIRLEGDNLYIVHADGYEKFVKADEDERIMSEIKNRENESSDDEDEESEESNDESMKVEEK